MIMARNADGSYKEITAIKTKDGSNIGKIVSKDGNVYFTSAVNATAEGYPCVLQNSVGKAAISYSIYGNSSPDNTVEAVSVGNKTKNLFNLADFQTDIHLDINTGLPVNHDKRCGITTPIEVSGNSFVLTFEARNGLDARYMYSLFDAENNLLIRATNGKSGDVVDFQNAKYVYIAFYDNSSTTVLTDDFSKIQFELGSAPTEYEPYGYKIPVVTRGKNLFDTNLNWFAIRFQPSDGRYFGSTTSALSPFIDIEGNKRYSLSINDGLQVGVFANFYIFDANKKHIGNNSTLDANYTSYINVKVQSTSTKILPANAKYIRISVRSYTNNEIMPIDTAKSLIVQVEEGSAATPYEPYKQSIATNIYLDEPLKTGEILKFPENVIVHTDDTEESVTLPKIPTFKGTTVITTDTEVKPSNMEITYKARR